MISLATILPSSSLRFLSSSGEGGVHAAGVELDEGLSGVLESGPFRALASMAARAAVLFSVAVGIFLGVISAMTKEKVAGCEEA
jgi:hypothetical protein